MTQAHIRVETPSGVVCGDMDVLGFRFRGIPYGDVGTGRDRFRTCKPARWAGVLEAHRFGGTAPQDHPGAAGSPPHFAWALDDEPRSESCLVLNVFTPSLDEAARLPVLVYLHGGGFAYGSSSAAALEGTKLAAQGAVVVT